MAITWQDTQQVRMQDASGTLNALNKAAEMTTGGISNALDTAVKNVTDARQQELQARQADASRFSAVSSGVNALGNMMEVQRKMSPEYQAMEKAKTQAALATAYSNLAGTKQEIDTQNIIRSELGLPPIQFDMPDMSTFGFGGATTPAPVDVNATPATALDASVAKVAPQPVVANADKAQISSVSAADNAANGVTVKAAPVTREEFRLNPDGTQTLISSQPTNAVDQTPLDQRVSKIQLVSSQNAPQDQTVPVTQTAPQTGFKNYSLVGAAGTQLGPVLQRRYDQTNATALGNEFQERLTAVSGGKGSQVAIDELRKDMTEMLNANGIQGNDAQRILNTTFGSIGITPAKDSATAIELDNRATTIATVDSAVKTGQDGTVTVPIDQVGKVSQFTKAELVAAKGNTLGNQIYNATLNTVYADANNATEDARFSVPEGTKMAAADTTANRDAYAKLKAFSDRAAFHYPNDENTRKELIARYVRDNQIDLDIVKSVDSARAADIDAAIRTASNELQSSEKLSSEQLDAIASRLAGIPHEKLTGIHEQMTGHAMSQISEDNQQITVNGVTTMTSLEKLANKFRALNISGYNSTEVLQHAEQINGFGQRLNDFVDTAVPGADAATKKVIADNLKTRLGIPTMLDKIEQQKKRNARGADFFSTKEFTQISRPSVQSMFAKEKYAPDEYQSNSANALKSQATNYIDAAIERMKKEGAIPADTVFDATTLRKLGFGAFGDMFDPDPEWLTKDVWNFTSSILGDSEIWAETKNVNWGDKQNEDAYQIFKQDMLTRIETAESDRTRYIDSKK